MPSSTSIAEVMDASGVKFGTSGARGLVSALTSRVAYAYAAGFLGYLESVGAFARGGAVAVGGDLRASTERILVAVAEAIRDRGGVVLHAGRLPSPALMAFAIERKMPSIMVTGSHIPDDRNGIKFNTATGEISKADEAGIRSQRVALPDHFDERGELASTKARGLPAVDAAPSQHYVKRWLSAFPRDLLRGRRIGVYGHSAVGRDLLVEIFAGLGAEVERLGWSERFISVDTEAIRPEDVDLARKWSHEQGFFALVSTDGDSDRPLIADENGKFLRGDVTGVISARFLDASFVAAPVSCNTVLERCGRFRTVRTKIGSPYVIEAMLEASRGGEPRVVGYEANGGFLTASELTVPGGGRLPALPTRDPLIVQLSVLAEAVRSGQPVSALTAALPQRFTASGRIAEYASERALRLLRELSAGGRDAMRARLPEFGTIVAVDEIDGLRMTAESDEILHLRASGNAPELRCYAEADSESRAEALVAYGLAAAAKYE